MAVNLSEIFTRIARDLHETNNEFASGSWSREEMVGYINYAERDFLVLSGIWKVDTTISAPAGSGILFSRPLNTMDLDRISFNGKALMRQTSFDFELEDRNWRIHTGGPPQYWHEDHLPNSQFELNKIPTAGGSLRIFADYLPDPYATIFEDCHLKDCWEPYLRWKVLSIALAKDCEDQDLGRSKYAQQRYMVGVMLARRLIKGLADTGLRG